jgi:hypothetical protein
MKMYVVDFKKERAEEILSAIQTGRAIPEPEYGWKRFDLLQVAGAIHFALFSQGPVRPDMDLPGFAERLAQQPFEHREATEETLTRDIQDATEFYSQLTMMVQDEQYDDKCEPHVQAYGTGKRVTFIKGAKQV